MAGVHVVISEVSTAMFVVRCLQIFFFTIPYFYSENWSSFMLCLAYRRFVPIIHKVATTLHDKEPSIIITQKHVHPAYFSRLNDSKNLWSMSLLGCIK